MIDTWEPLYINQRENHDELFNEVAREEFEQALDRAIGPEWRRHREEPEIADPEIANDIPHDVDDLDLWFPR